MMPRKSIPVGTLFGYLQVIGVGTPILRKDTSGTRSTSVVKCALCGQEKEVANSELLKGGYRSCGCIQGNHRHGGRNSRLYRIWCGMKYRCSGKSKSLRNKPYVGIHVCKEWAENFETFRLWAMSHGYTDNLSIDRINPEGDYQPSNCRWIPLSDQSGNRCTNSSITAFGKTRTYAEWGRATGISSKLIRQRIVRQGMSPEMALTTKGKHK